MVSETSGIDFCNISTINIITLYISLPQDRPKEKLHSLNCGACITKHGDHSYITICKVQDGFVEIENKCYLKITEKSNMRNVGLTHR